MVTNLAYLDMITVVLHRPRFPENIGAAARAASNMGIHRLLVVAPEELDLERVRRMATHAAEAVVDRMQVHQSLAAALAPFQFVVGTTARTGGQRLEIRTPRQIAGEIRSVAENNRVALVFGPEDRGLTNEELRRCHALVTIPTAGFSSLNLAQAVMVMCYELLLAAADPAPPPAPRLATRRELDGMYEHLKETLVKINFINPQNPDYWMHTIRRYFSRVGLRARDVKVIRGICRQIDWYTRRRVQTLEDLLEDQ